MEVKLIGVGLGNPDTMTVEARAAVEDADWAAGSSRLVEQMAREGQSTFIGTRAGELLEALKASGAQRPCVLYSGDTGFYSGTKTLIPLLEEAGISYKVLPGLSSVQYLAARLGRPWQDWRLVSAHGLDCDPVGEVLMGRDVFFLTSGRAGAGELCRKLTDAGLGGLQTVVGQALSYPEEEVSRGTAEEFSERMFAPLSVLLVEGAAPRRRAVTHGIPDEAFIRGEVPMTKQEVRAAALSKLEICEGDILYDIGAGTGSVSVEMALMAKRGKVYAVERKPEALALMTLNRERFGAYQMIPVAGRAPEALAALPAPDAVFIGGSGGSMDEILSCVFAKNPKARVCVSAIAVETLGAAAAALTKQGRAFEVSQVWASRSRRVANLNLMMGQNPVWLICTEREEEP